MAVLTGQAQRSESSRPVKPSITRLPTFPGSGAFFQPSTGPNSHSSGRFLPPARRYLRYSTASRQTVPTPPAKRPATTAASGVIGCFPVRIPDPNCYLSALSSKPYLSCCRSRVVPSVPAAWPTPQPGPPLAVSGEHRVDWKINPTTFAARLMPEPSHAARAVLGRGARLPSLAGRTGRDL